MKDSEQFAPRGRPRTITRKRIAEAGIAVGLPNITLVGVSAAMGVSHMALYKHVASLAELKRLVAEEIFSRWQIPVPHEDSHDGLEAYLTVFAASVREFVKAHPGVTPYVIRRLAATPAMLAKIEGHQSHIAEVSGLSKKQARWLLATVAFHALAASDTVYSVAGQDPALEGNHAQEEAEMEEELNQGIKALVVGVLTMLKNDSWQSESTRFIDTSALPRARMPEFPRSAEQINQWLADMEALILAKKDFVLIYDRLPALDQPGDPDGRKRVVLWLKAHRNAFETHCRGMVLMCRDVSALPGLQEMRAPLSKAYRVPVRIACTEDEVQAHVSDLTASTQLKSLESEPPRN